MNINYLLASWSGRNCLQRHVEQLKKVENDLAQITIGVPHNPDEPKEFTEFLATLRKPFKVFRLPNQGMSYGQWVTMMRKYKNRFSHYILAEDDYVPVKDHFDTILAKMFDELDCGYLCGTVFDHTGRFIKWAELHAAVSNGITSWQYVKRCQFPEVWGEYSKAQLEFSRAFLAADISIVDWLHEYQCTFWNKRSFQTYREIGEEDIFLPIEALDGMSGHRQYIVYYNHKRIVIDHK